MQKNWKNILNGSLVVITFVGQQATIMSPSFAQQGVEIIQGGAAVGTSAPLQTDANSTSNLVSAINGGTGTTGGALPPGAVYMGGAAESAEPTANASATLIGPMHDLVGKYITSPFANRELMVRATASTVGSSAVTLLAAVSGVKFYITDIECSRLDAGTTAVMVTFNDSATTMLVLPNNGGGGGFMKPFNVPLAMAAANATLTFAVSANISTVVCAVQGFKGY